MNTFIEQIAIYGFTFLLITVILLIYIIKQKRESKEVEDKIEIAKEEGWHEPVTLYPVVDPNRCLKSGACITACPEKDILGIRNGKATTINASLCIGHGACVKACPVGAISLYIGTEKRGVDIPELSDNFETNVPGIFISGELGGMGLIKNAVTQGAEAVEYISQIIQKDSPAEYDLIVVGAGPAGIGATLNAKKNGLKVLTLEQDTLGGTIATFPRSKIVMTSPMQLPLYGKVKLVETTKPELMRLWETALSKNKLSIQENTKVESIHPENGYFKITASTGETYTTQKVLLAVGRRGTPRKLGIPGEMTEKVAYRLLEPEDIHGKKIVIVGGGDSAVESALLLAPQNQVTLSYRGEAFSRIKQKNAHKIADAMAKGSVNVLFNTNLVSIDPHSVSYKIGESDEIHQLENDRVYIFAGGELPVQFLKKMGISMCTKHGEVILKH